MHPAHTLVPKFSHYCPQSLRTIPCLVGIICCDVCSIEVEGEGPRPHTCTVPIQGSSLWCSLWVSLGSGPALEEFKRLVPVPARTAQPHLLVLSNKPCVLTGHAAGQPSVVSRGLLSAATRDSSGGVVTQDSRLNAESAKVRHLCSPLHPWKLQSYISHTCGLTNKESAYGLWKSHIRTTCHCPCWSWKYSAPRGPST